MLICILTECITNNVCDIELWGIIVNALIMLCGFIALVVEYKRNNRQESLSLYEKYTARYMHLMEQMPKEFYLATPDDELPKQTLENINHYIRLYIDLSSEEVFLKHQNSICGDFWKEWEDGIEGTFKNPFVQDYWQKNEAMYKEEYKSFYHFITNKDNN